MRYHAVVVMITSVPLFSAFDWKGLFKQPNLFKQPSLSSASTATLNLEQNLVSYCKSQSLSASQVIAMFEELERVNPSKENLLEDPESLSMINGPWNLLYTISNYVGSEEDLSTSGVGGVVNASGIQVEATERTNPIQGINTTSLEISNEVFVKLPIMGEGLVKVIGSFKGVPGFGRRAEVDFQRLEVYKATDGVKKGSLFSAEWPFKLQKKLNPELANGADQTSWLDTTYLSPRVRLGRGNKGSIFVLEKEVEES